MGKILIMKFIKKQLIRSLNIIKAHWIFLIIEFDDDMDLTWFGNWFLKTLMFGLFVLYIPFIITLMPLWLVIFKFDENNDI